MKQASQLYIQRLPKMYAGKGQRRIVFITIWKRGKTTTAMYASNAKGNDLLFQAFVKSPKEDLLFLVIDNHGTLYKYIIL